jgi:uncharacterized membrane protein
MAQFHRHLTMMMITVVMMMICWLVFAHKEGKKTKGSIELTTLLNY